MARRRRDFTPAQIQIDAKDAADTCNQTLLALAANYFLVTPRPSHGQLRQHLKQLMLSFQDPQTKDAIEKALMASLRMKFNHKRSEFAGHIPKYLDGLVDIFDQFVVESALRQFKDNAISGQLFAAILGRTGYVTQSVEGQQYALRAFTAFLEEILVQHAKLQISQRDKSLKLAVAAAREAMSTYTKAKEREQTAREMGVLPPQEIASDSAIPATAQPSRPLSQVPIHQEHVLATASPSTALPAAALERSEQSVVGPSSAPAAILTTPNSTALPAAALDRSEQSAVGPSSARAAILTTQRSTPRPAFELFCDYYADDLDEKDSASPETRTTALKQLWNKVSKTERARFRAYEQIEKDAFTRKRKRKGKDKQP